MSIFNELDSVFAVRNLSDNILTGTKGVIHQIYENGNDIKYLVEFLEKDNISVIDIIDVDETDLKLSSNHNSG